MKKLSTYKKYLESLGYKEEFYESLSGMLTSIDYIDDHNNQITLFVSPSNKYEEYLDSLNEGDEINIDYNQFNVIGALIKCSICNISGFTDGDTSGIRLSGYPNDDNDGFIEDNYYTDHLDKFKKCVWIQRHMNEHEMFILKRHIENLNTIKNVYVPILNKYGYYQTYSSIFDADDESGYKRYCSSPYLEFTTKTSTIEDKEMHLSTNCITGELLFNDESISFPSTKKNFDKYFIDNILTDKVFGGIKSHFKYLFDKDYTVESEANIFSAYSVLRRIEDFKEQYDEYKFIKSIIRDINSIDFNAIPDKDFKDIKEKLHQYIKDNQSYIDACDK